MVYSIDLGCLGVWKCVYIWCCLMFVVILARVGRALAGWRKTLSLTVEERLMTFLILAFHEAWTTMEYGFGFGYWEPSKITECRYSPFTNHWNFNMFVKKPQLVLLACWNQRFSGPLESILKAQDSNVPPHYLT
jgi:nitrate reductase gamma subunit